MQDIVKSLAFDYKVFLGQLVMLIALLVIMNALFWKPYLAHLKARDQGMADAHATHDRLIHDMESLRADYLGRIGQVEAEARTRIQTAIKEAQTERERLIKEAREQSDATLKNGIADMEREKQESLVSLRETMIRFAVEAAGKALGSAADPSALRRSIEQNLASRN